MDTIPCKILCGFGQSSFVYKARRENDLSPISLKKDYSPLFFQKKCIYTYPRGYRRLWEETKTCTIQKKTGKRKKKKKKRKVRKKRKNGSDPYSANYTSLATCALNECPKVMCAEFILLTYACVCHSSAEPTYIN